MSENKNGRGLRHHWWAYDNQYGTRALNAETLERLGELVRFDTRRERDAWVAADTYPHGDVCRKAVDAADARGIMHRTLRREPVHRWPVRYEIPTDMESLWCDYLEVAE